MSAAPAAHSASRPPEVDEGEAVSVVTVVLEALAPSKARLHMTLLVLAPMLVVLAIWETFRLPEPAIACFMLLMLARGDAVSTTSNSILMSAMVALGSLISVVVLAFTLSQPAVRIPVMALMTFTTMMLVRGTKLGQIAFIVGFFATYGTTSADNLLGLASSTADVTNTEGFGRPQSDFFPAEEALLHSALWLGFVAIVPAMLLLVVNRFAGTDPRSLLLGKLRARAEAVTAFCRGEPKGSEALHAVAREGIAPLLDLAALSEKAHHRMGLHDVHVQLIRGFNRLILLMIAWEMARNEDGAADHHDAEFLREVAFFVDAFHTWLQPTVADGATLPELPRGTEHALGGALPSLAVEIRVVVEYLREVAVERAHILHTDPSKAAPKPPAPFLLPDAFGKGNIQFALKVTLTVMTSYLIESGLDWQGIGTCVVTCFFVALGTVGETIHKATLRITGALIGGALGIGSIIVLMPVMTEFGQLAVLFGAVAFASIWIAFGSARVAYAGWQILLAFALTTLQGWGPTLDMQTARDRVVGILLGNLVTTLVFLFVWPHRVGDAVRGDIAKAFDQLSKMMALEGTSGLDERRAEESSLRDAFTLAIAHAGGIVPNDHFEPSPGDARDGRLSRPALARVARLVVPVSVIATDGVEPSARASIPQHLRDDVRAYHTSMAAWFADAAAWVRTGEGRASLRANLPRPPAIGTASGSFTPDDPGADHLAPELARRIHARAALYVLLQRQIDDFLDIALPVARDAPSPQRSLSLAAS